MICQIGLVNLNNVKEQVLMISFKFDPQNTLLRTIVGRWNLFIIIIIFFVLPNEVESIQLNKACYFFFFLTTQGERRHVIYFSVYFIFLDIFFKNYILL